MPESRFKLVILLACWILLPLSGCNHMALLGSPASNLTNAIEQQKFERAHYILDHIKEQHPEYDQVQQQENQLQQAITSWKKDIHGRVQKMIREENWKSAHALLDKEQKKWHPGMEESRQLLNSKEQAFIRKLSFQTLVTEARARLSMQNPLERLALTTKPDASRELRLQEQRNSYLAKHLTTRGKEAIELQKWNQAQTLLELAQQLYPSAERNALLLAAKKQTRKQLQQKRSNLHATRVRQAGKLLGAYEQSKKINDLVEAKHYIEKYNQDGFLIEQTEQLNQHINQRFNEDFRKGENLYAQGKYQQAWDTWSPITRLKPHDKNLEEKMERAKRVLSNLQQLQ